jgi:predicted GIY-YIG superfamily endonuclease
MALSKLKSREGSRDEARRRGGREGTHACVFLHLEIEIRGLVSGRDHKPTKTHPRTFSGKGCLTTRKDPPVELVFKEIHETFGKARKREIQVKKWSFNKKSALVEGQWDVLKRLSKSHDD